MNTVAVSPDPERVYPGEIRSGLANPFREAGLPAAFGFRNGRGGVHTSRTMMFADLDRLLSSARPQATRDEFRHAVVDENVLGKRTVTTRRKTAVLLRQLYALDPQVVVFRAMAYLWDRDGVARPLLALLCAAARDPILRGTASTVLSTAPGEVVTSTDLENAIARSAPGRFCGTTLRTTARNVASTWTQSGHLHGHRVKRRSGAEPTAAAVAYSLLLGYLAGASGGMLLTTFWARLLDAPREHISSLAAEASARRWIEYRQAGQVLEVRFPDLLTPDELEMRREQD